MLNRATFDSTLRSPTWVPDLYPEQDWLWAGPRTARAVLARVWAHPHTQHCRVPTVQVPAALLWSSWKPEAAFWVLTHKWAHEASHFISQCLPTQRCHNTQLAQLEEGLARSSVQPNQRTQIAASGAARAGAAGGRTWAFRCCLMVAVLCFMATWKAAGVELECVFYPKVLPRNLCQLVYPVVGVAERFWVLFPGCGVQTAGWICSSWYKLTWEVLLQNFCPRTEGSVVFPWNVEIVCSSWCSRIVLEILQ